MEQSICSLSTRSKPTAAGRTGLGMASGPSTRSICAPARRLVDPAAPSPGCRHTHTLGCSCPGTQGQSCSSGTREQAREKELLWEKHVQCPHSGKKALQVMLRHSRLVLEWEVSGEQLTPGCIFLCTVGGNCCV